MLLEPLEQRVLYSADLNPAAASSLDDIGDYREHSIAALSSVLEGSRPSNQPALPDEIAHPAIENTDPPSVELLVIDANVQDISTLLEQLDGSVHTEILFLNADTDGLTQISNKLSNMSDVNAIHVVSHGSEGVLELGNSKITEQNISDYSTDLGNWKNHLTDDADILLYGCDIAGSDSGQQLLQSFATLCDCDITASTDTTGSSSLGGNWSLEYSHGQIDTDIVFLKDSIENWNNTLIGAESITVDTVIDYATSDTEFGDTSSITALLNDKGSDDLISLREAIIAANNTSGVTNILLGPDTYVLSITGDGESNAERGDLDIKSNIMISGVNPANTVIEGAMADRLFEVQSGASLTLDNVTLSGANSGTYDGAAVSVASNATLDMHFSVLTQNSAHGTNGGAIATSGTVNIDQSTIFRNSANNGGGLAINGGITTITNSTISGNIAQFDGGGAWVKNTGTLNVSFSTLTDNVAVSGKGGGISNTAGIFTADNSILADNLAMFSGDDIYNTFTSNGHNIVKDTQSLTLTPTDFPGVSASLNSIDEHTATGLFIHLPTSDSVAIDNAGAAPPLVDQVGNIRTDPSDIGAIDSGADTGPSVTAPTLTIITSDTAALTEDSTLTFDGSQLLQVDDGITADKAIVVELTVSTGKIQLGSLTGISVLEGNNASANIVLQGLESDINQALTTLQYTPDSNYSGTASLLVELALHADIFGEYTFENSNAEDTSPGNNHHGQLLGGATVVADATRGNVLSLNGASDQVLFTEPFNSPTSFALGGWVNLDAGATHSQFINIDNNISIDLSDTSGITASINTSNGPAQLTSNITIDGTGWHHVYYVFDNTSSTHTLYLDGQAIASDTISGAASWASNNTTFLGSLEGRLDDIRLFGRSLSVEEVLGLYNNTNDLSQTITIEVTPVNDQPVLSTNTGTTVNPASTTIITSVMLHTTDIDDSATNLQYNITAVTNGHLELSTDIGLAINSFTQQDIDNNQLVFVHNSPAIEDAFFEFTVRDDLDDGTSSISDSFEINVNHRAFPDNYSSTEDTLLIVVAPGVLENDHGATGTPIAGNTVASFDARTDESNDTVWSSHNSSIELTLVGGTSHTDAPDNAITGITNAFDFNGLNSGAISSPLENFTEISGNAPASIELWVHYDPQANDAVIFDSSLPDGSGLALVREGSNIELYANGSSIANASIVFNQWHHIVVTADIANGIDPVRLFVDGIPSGSSNLHMSSWAPGSFGLGVSNGGFAESIAGNLQGQIASLRFYDHLLSPSEITQNAANPGGTDSAQPTVSQVFDDNTTGIVTVLTNGGFSYDPTNQLDYLATGDTFVDTFDYVYRDPNGEEQQTTVEITITGVNDAPGISGIETTPAIHTENEPATILTNSITLSDVDNNTLQSATITINDNLKPFNDELVFIDQSGIQGNYNSINGTLTLTGNASVVDYQSAIRSVAYLNTSENPSTDTRTVSIFVSDGEANSDTLTRSINIINQNDSPVITTNTGINATVGESVPIDNTSLLATDPDDSGAGLNYNVTTTTNGALVLSTNPAVEINTFTQQDIDLGILRFVHDGLSTNNGSFIFSLADGGEDNSLAVNGTYVISVSGAVADNYTTDENTPLVVNAPGVLSNDSQSTGGSVAAIDTSSTVGTVNINPNGSFTYDPAGGFDSLNSVSSAQDTFIYVYEDNQGNQQTATVFITVSGVNDVPVLATIETTPALFIENGPPVTVSNTLEVLDLDNSLLASASIRISNNFHTNEDELTFTALPGIIGNYDQSNGLITLTGTASLTDYASVLHSIKYNNLSDNPTTQPRTIEFSVSDQTGSSNTLTRQIDIISANDAPQLSPTGPSIAQYIENELAITLPLAPIATDVDNTTLESATISFVGTFDNQNDLLSFADTANISSSFNNTTGILTLSGTAPLADYTAALASVSFLTSSDAPNTQSRSIDFSVNDGTNWSDAIRQQVDVIATNDSPLLSDIEPEATTFTENGIATTLSNTLSLSDLDNNTLSSATVSITEGFASAEDTLNFTTQGNITGIYNNTTGILELTGSASLTDYETVLRSVAYSNTSDNPSTPARTIEFIINDGTSTGNTLTRTINVTAVNDAPELHSASLSSVNYSEGSNPEPVIDDLNITDIDNLQISSATASLGNSYVAAEDILTIAPQANITTSFTNGTLTLTGAASIDDYQAALRTVAYRNISDTPDNSVRSVSFQVFDGEDLSTELTNFVTINSIDTPPELLAIETTALNYTENSEALITDTITISDQDSPLITSATVSITQNHIATEDTLTLLSENGISSIYDAANGVLTLTGTASIADYQTALRSVTYSNLSDNPTIDARTVQFSVFDGVNSSALVERQINITPVNDAPGLSGNHLSTLVFTENSPNQLVNSSVIINDIDNTSLIGATVAITDNYIATEDTLIYQNQNGIDGTFDSSTGILQLSGSATLENYQAALRSVAYSNNSESPTELTRSIEIQVTDNSEASNNLLHFIDVEAVNDIPVLNNIEGNTLTYLENQPAIDIAPSITVSDADQSVITTASITITENFQTSEDVLDFTPLAGITGFFNNSTGELTLNGAATALQYQQALQSVNYLNLSNNPNVTPKTISFTVQDLSGTSEPVFRVLEVISVNDPPEAISIEVDLPEDTSRLLSLEDIGFNDPLDQNQLQSVLVEQVPSNGVVSVGDTPVIEGQFISSAEFILGNVRFTPDEHWFGSTELHFNVVDDGGITASGIDTSVVQNTLTFNVLAVSDQPIGLNTSITLAEDTAHIFTVDNFSFTDADSDQLQSIVINTVPDTGHLVHNSGIVINGSVIPVNDIENGLLQFTAASEGGTDQLLFQVRDTGSEGLNTDPTVNTIDITTEAVNDNPLLTTTGQTLDEGSSVSITIDTLNAIDADDTTDQLTFTISESPEYGTLRLNNTELDVGDTFLQSEIEQNLLSYSHDGSETSTDVFSVTLTDSLSAVPVTGQFVLTINEVIDPAPAVFNESINIEANTSIDTSDSDTLDSGFKSLGREELTHNPLLLITIAEPPQHGTVTISPDGTFIYSHNGSDTNRDSFTYRITNEDEVSAVATVEITIDSPMVNPGPRPVEPPEPEPEPEPPQGNAQAAPTLIINTLEATSNESNSAPDIPELAVETVSETETSEAMEEATDDRSDNTSAQQISDNATQTEAQIDLNQIGALTDTQQTIDNLEVVTSVRTIPGLEQLGLTRDGTVLANVGIRQHNLVDGAQVLDQDYLFQTTGITFITELSLSKASESAGNKNFQRGLDQFDHDLQDTEDEIEKRYEVANDTAVGVSISTTAGILAWTLRGGALFASAMASTPLWSSIDPIKVVAGRKEDEQEEDSEVESYFDR